MRKLEHNLKQEEVWNSYAKNKILFSGRRSGKTELAKRHIINIVSDRKRDINLDSILHRNYFILCPTKWQAKRIYWEDLKTYANEINSLKSNSKLGLSINLWGGNSIYLYGLEDIDELRQRDWDGGVVDEVDDIEEDIWSLYLKDLLSVKNGWCWFVGKPGKEFSQKLFYEYSRLDQWEYFNWSSTEILPKEEIEGAKIVLSEEVYKQEFEANFINKEK